MARVLSTQMNLDMNINNIAQQWDLVIIGGGITGAGILREATNMGLQALLVEQKDFAWGTSSRSSKLVHGGLRYLKEGHFLLTKMAVEEREHVGRAPGIFTTGIRADASRQTHA
jgi:glycerol-3-phosphate dehydrogenase